MMFTKENRTTWDDAKLGFIFGFFGGYNNAAAIAVLLYEIAPMSANWGGLAKAFGADDLSIVYIFLSIVLCFISGAFIGASWSRKKDPSGVVIAEAILLISVAFLGPEYFKIAVAVGALAMGMQNGMTTFISHHAVRTSHLTSTVTDLGISLARGNRTNAWIKGSKTITYMCGAIVGTLKAQFFGTYAFAMGGAYLLILMIARRYMVTSCESCIKRGEFLEDWLAKVQA